MPAFHLKHRVILIAGLLLTTLLHAEDPPPLLWRIHGSPPSYLFGSIHTAHPELNRLPASVREALAKADAFYSELTFDPATLAEARRAFLLPPGERLGEHLSAQTRERLERALTAIDPGLRLADLDRLKVWALATTLPVLEEQRRFGTQPVMDQRLYLQAARAGKRTGGLESACEQAAVFDKLNEDEQRQLLKATLGTLEKARRQGNSLLEESYAAYRSGNPERFRHLMNEQMDVPFFLKLKLERLLLTERNERMAQRIDQLLQQHPQDAFFFAVGAAHYSGPHSLQRLLSDRGYRVRRVAE